MRGWKWICAVTLAGSAGLLLSPAQAPDTEERLARHRNLGKAFYENPTTHRQAVEEFRKALDLAPNSIREKLNYGLALIRAGRVDEGVAALQEVQKRDPQLPHTWFNLGLHYRKSGDPKQAIAQFERMVALVPEEAVAHYQLGALYRQEGRLEEARAAFERAAELDPQLAAPRFQLFNLHRQARRSTEAARYLEEFNRLRKQAEGSAIPEDVEWCNYAEIYDPPAPPAVDVSRAEPRFETRTLDLASATGLVAVDATGAAQSDLLA